MFTRMEEDMDVNCGLITDGEASVAEMGEIIFQKILATASGERTKSEELGYGDEEFVPWHIGAVM
jgi:altronate hydrolase